MAVKINQVANLFSVVGMDGTYIKGFDTLKKARNYCKRENLIIIIETTNKEI